MGNFGLQQYRGVLNLPLGDDTAVRLSGYTTSEDSEIENIVTGKEGDDESWGGRLRVLSNMTDDLEAILTLERHDVKARNMVREKSAYGQRTLGYAAATCVTLLEPDLFDREAQMDVGDGRDQTATSGALHVSWNINDTWSFQSVTGYQDFTRDNHKSDRPGGYNDASQGLFGMFSYRGDVNDTSLTQEFRFTYDGDSLSSVTGVYYEDTELKSLTDILNKISPTYAVPLRAHGDRNNEDFAIFSHNIYTINSQWDLTAGLRYSMVDRDDRIDNLINVGYFSSDPYASPSPLSQKKDWSAVSGTLKLLYHMNEDINIYGGYDRAFKAGGHNIVSSNLPTFDEEVADNYVLGIKGVLFERLRWDTSVFYMEYTDYQVNSPSTLSATSLYSERSFCRNIRN